MGKLPYLKFYTGDWIKDANLRRCSPNARAVFIDLLCIMFDCEERGILGSNGEPWTEEEVAQAIPGDTFQNLLGVQELLRNHVIRKDDQGFCYSKRMLADEQERKEWSARQSRHRKQKEYIETPSTPVDVTRMSRLSSHSHSYSPSNSKEPFNNSNPQARTAFSLTPQEEEFALAQFDLFWNAFPKKVDREDTLQAFLSISPIDQQIAAESVQLWIKSGQWDEIRYVPSPLKFIQKRRWEYAPKTETKEGSDARLKRLENIARGSAN